MMTILTADQIRRQDYLCFQDASLCGRIWKEESRIGYQDVGKGGEIPSSLFRHFESPKDPGYEPFWFLVNHLNADF